MRFRLFLPLILWTMVGLVAAGDTDTVQRKKMTLAPPQKAARHQTSRAPEPDDMPDDYLPRAQPTPAEPERDAARNSRNKRDTRGTRYTRDNNGNRRPDHPRRVPERWESEARREAQWAARQLAERDAYRASYRLGWFRAYKRIERNHERMFQHDYREGRFDGDANHDAQRQGHAMGDEDAQAAALHDAEQSVRDQFLNLNRTPLRNPLVPQPPVPDYGSLVDFDEPAPLPRFIKNYGDHNPLNANHPFLNGWAPGSPADWAGVNHYRRLPRPQAPQPQQGFDYWCDTRRGRQIWQQLPRAAKTEFKNEFMLHFGPDYNDAFGRDQRAYRDGWYAGWDHAGAMYADYHYQRGYFETSRQSFLAAAEDSFRRQYNQAFRHRYDDSFDQWYSNPKPEIGRLTVRDGNDDGVLAPGESFELEAELINYGGRGGRFGLDLVGDAMARGVKQPVRLDARSTTRVVLRRGIIRDNVPSRTMAVFTLDLGAVRRRFEHRIEHPIQLGEIRIDDRNDLRGYLRLSIPVRNVANRDSRGVEAVIDGRREHIGSLRAGGETRIHFEQNNLAPLDLIGGSVAVPIELRSGRHVQEVVQYSVPQSATDLQRRDLLLYMVELAKSRRRSHATQAAVNRAQDLMLERMRVDWQAAVAARGNPYKTDHREGSRNTALGDLVHTFNQQRRLLARPEIFTEMQPKLEALARQLPGTHPFLRKQFRRLARELG